MIGYMIFSRINSVSRYIVTNARVIGIVTEVKVAGAVKFGENT